MAADNGKMSRSEMHHYATKADLAELKSALIQWIVGVMFSGIVLASGVAYAIARVGGP